jgi:glycosyltransferase involved in cell wall biosynthesis
MVSPGMAAALTVLIANHNTSAFLEVAIPALDELTENPLTVLVHDDGSDPRDLEALAVLERRHPAVRVFHRPSSLSGSYAHGDAVDFMVPQVETPYTAILDADCTPLMRGWDGYLIGRLDETTKIVGSRLGEGWSGNKPIDFPLPFLALFETETYRRLGISAKPGEDPAERDTCWQWRPRYLEAGYRGETLLSVNTRLDPRPPFEQVHCAAYYTQDGRLLGSHFGRGSNPAAKWGRRRGLRRHNAQAREWARQRDLWLEVCRAQIAREAPQTGLRATTR